VLFRCGTADGWHRAGTETTSGGCTEIDAYVSIRHAKGLCVGVHRHELDTTKVRVDHAVDRVHTCATYTNDLDRGEVALVLTSAVASFWLTDASYRRLLLYTR
jgi:hypothetical protein